MYKILFCFTLLVFLSTLSNAQKFIEAEKKLIVGRWVAEDKSRTYVFGKDSICKIYVRGKLFEAYKYKITFLNSFCHKESENTLTKEEAELQELSYLEFVGNDGITMCYEINGITNKTLSISYIFQPAPLVFNRVVTSASAKK